MLFKGSKKMCKKCHMSVIYSMNDVIFFSRYAIIIIIIVSLNVECINKCTLLRQRTNKNYGKVQGVQNGIAVQCCYIQ